MLKKDNPTGFIFQNCSVWTLVSVLGPKRHDIDQTLNP